MQQPSYTYYKEIFAQESLPLAFVDLDLFDQNIQEVLKRAGGKKIRIASKSIRSVTLIRRILNTHSQFQGLMCYSVREALFLIDQGFDHLLVAYPSLQKKAIQQVCEKLREHKHLTLMVDSIEHIRQLNAIGQIENICLSICLDIDMSSSYPLLHFGVRRSGLTNRQQLLPILEKIRNAPYVRLEGVMGYEAQISGVPDHLPKKYLMNCLLAFLKKCSRKELTQRRQNIVNSVFEAGFPLDFVNGGGTGSLESTCQESVVTEVTAGSAFFSPTLFDYYRSFKHLPAAAFALEISRHPTETIFTCHGGGYVASGAVGTEKLPTPYLPTGASLLAMEGAGEVQTPVFYKGSEMLHLGDPLFFRHSKAGELCEHFNELYLVSQGKIVDRVKTYRGEGYCFL